MTSRLCLLLIAAFDLVDRVAALEARESAPPAAVTARPKPLADWTEDELREVVRAEFAKPPLTP